MTTIGDIVTLQRGNTYKSALLGLPGPVLLGLGSIQRNGGFKGSKLETYGGESDPRMLLDPGDLYVSLKDVTQSADLLGAVARVPTHIAQGRLTQDTVKLVFKSDALPPEYIYWLLRTPQYRAFCRSFATGTTNLGLPRDDFLAYEIPDLTPEREAILTALGALDDKIELNRRMNETLEAMAQAIFRDWFVDFGPTRRKLAGITDPVEIMGGLSPDPTRAAALAALFPDALSDSGLPMGWIESRVDDLLELAYGKSLTKSDRRDGHVPVYGSGGLTGTHNEPLVEGPTIIVGRKGTVGSLFWEDRDCFPIDTVFYVVPRAPLPFCFYMLQTLGLTGMNTDAAVPGLNRNNVYRLTVPHAVQAQESFASIASPLRLRISHNEVENKTLAATRDLILPKLMSGEIRLRDAEQFLGGAA